MRRNRLAFSLASSSATSLSSVVLIVQPILFPAGHHTVQDHHTVQSGFPLAPLTGVAGHPSRSLFGTLRGPEPCHSEGVVRHINGYLQRVRPTALGADHQVQPYHLLPRPHLPFISSGPVDKYFLLKGYPMYYYKKKVFKE